MKTIKGINQIFKIGLIRAANPALSSSSLLISSLKICVYLCKSVDSTFRLFQTLAHMKRVLFARFDFVAHLVHQGFHQAHSQAAGSAFAD